MPILGKLLGELLQNAGYDIEANADVVGSLLALDQDVPDEVASPLKSNLLTLESAKNSPEIKKHFTAQALNTVDTTLYEYADEYGEIPEEKLSAIRAEKSSYKKQRMMLDALKDIERGKQGAAGANDETKAQLDARKAKIEELSQELNTIKSSHEDAIRAAQSEAQNKILNYAQNAELGMRDFAQEDLDKSTNVMIARQIVDSYLKEVGAAPIAGEDGSIRLVQANDPQMDFMLENKKISFGSLADKILGEKKLLKVSDPNPAPRGAGAGAGNNPLNNPNGGGAGAQAFSREASAAYDSQIAALTGGN
jgi:hypothetical protein